jgi:hypothetical protein
MALIIPFAAFLFSPSLALAGPVLGSNLSLFAILGGAGVTFDGTGNVVVGSVGSNGSSSAITGYPAQVAQSGGTVYTAADPVTLLAQTELSTAITALNGLGTGTTYSSLSGQTLGPGVYTSSATTFTGTITLNGLGNANALWVLLFTSGLTTASSSSVNVINTGAGAGVYWVVSGGAVLGSNSVFEGNILASSSINVGPNVTDLCGRLLAQTESVTLAGGDNTVSTGCSGILAGSSALGGGGTLNEGGTFVRAEFAPIGSVPEPGTVPLLCVGFLALTLYGWQSRKRVA